jgi:hypothetical protein
VPRFGEDGSVVVDVALRHADRWNRPLRTVWARHDANAEAQALSQRGLEIRQLVERASGRDAVEVGVGPGGAEAGLASRW